MKLQESRNEIVEESKEEKQVKGVYTVDNSGSAVSPGPLTRSPTPAVSEGRRSAVPTDS